MTSLFTQGVLCDLSVYFNHTAKFHLAAKFPWLEEKELGLAGTAPQEEKRAAHSLFGVGIHTGEFRSFWQESEGVWAPSDS